ncbi:MAG TPA: alpha/beta fold hydrolase [Thermoleophilaceae bacterium]|nr:alpha/beta fold hydrolase [Thermoleophilaceae bacterium]
MTAQPLDRQTIDVDGDELAFATVDLRPPWAPDATPIVFLHGLGLSLDVWRPWIAAVAADRPVLAIDLRGHGESAAAWSADGYPFERFVDDLERVLDAAGVDAFHFVGESFGGTIGLAFAAANPARVRSVTTCSTAFDGTRIANIAHWPDLVATEEGMTTWVEEIVSGRLGPDVDPAIAEWLAARQRNIDPRVVTGIAICLMGVDLSDAVGKLQAPLLVISPERSPFVDPSNAEALAAAAPRGELAFVSGAFHGVVLSHWRDCVARLRPFLARVEGKPATGGPLATGLDGDWVSGIGSHIAIEVPDIEAGLRFYRDILGLEEDWRHALEGGFLTAVTGLEDATGGVVQLLCPGGSRIELWLHQPRGDDDATTRRTIVDPGLDHVSFGVRDVREVHQRLAAAGVRFVVEPIDVEDPQHPLHGWQAAYFEDPWGTRLEIVGPSPGSGLASGAHEIGTRR